MPTYKGIVTLTVDVPVSYNADDEQTAKFMLTEHFCLCDWVRDFLTPVLEGEDCNCYRATTFLKGILEEIKE